jgi:hypothetical protein
MGSEETRAFTERISNLPHDAGAHHLDSVLEPSIVFESELRKTFATEKNSALLNDPYIGIIDIFKGPDSIRTTKARVIKGEKDLNAHHVFPVQENARRATGQPSMVSSIEEFQKNW